MRSRRRRGQRPLQRGGVAHGLVRATLERRRHGGDARRVLHARAALALAVVAARIGGDADPASHVQRADPGRAAELVRRAARAGRRSSACDVDGEPPHGLARVGVEPHACLAREPRRLADLLHRAQLVVGVLHAGQQRARACGPPRRSDRGRPVRTPSTGTSIISNPSLCSALHTPPTAGCSTAPTTIRVPSSRTARDAAPDRQGDRFGAARREDDLVGLGAERVGDGLASTRRGASAPRDPARGCGADRRRCRGRRRTPREPRAAAGWR